MTSPFKVQVANDVKAVFVNSTEFADWHDIDGRRVLCVLDADLYKERQTQLSQRIDGVITDILTLFVESRDLPRKPRTGQRMMVNRELYVVDEVSEAMGVYEITLEANRQ